MGIKFRPIKIFILLLLLCNFFNTRGQECKFKRNEIDKETSMNVRITEDFNIHGGLFSKKTCSLRLIQNDTSYFVKLLFTYSGRHHIVLQNSELIFLFDKDSITLHAARNDTAANIWIGQYNFMRLIAKYSINKSDLFLLTKTSIAKIKFFTIKKPYELDIENSSAEAIKKYALCILNQ